MRAIRRGVCRAAAPERQLRIVERGCAPPALIWERERSPGAPHTIVPVFFCLDESGDYAFPRTGSTLPRQRVAEISAFAEDRKAAWGVEEVHASELDREQLSEVARFIGRSDCRLLAHVTDTARVTQRGIAQFRVDQAGGLRRNLDWYRRESTKAIGAPVPEIEQWYLRCADAS